MGRNSIIFDAPKGNKTEPCYKCGKRLKIAKLCDAGNGVLSTCDKVMCEKCAHEVGEDVHVCDEHFNDIGIAKAKKNRERLKRLEENT